MKILHIVAGLPLGGGISTAIPFLAMYQKSLGHVVSIATLEDTVGAEKQETLKHGVELLIFKRSWPHFLFFSWGMFFCFFRTAKRVDVIHVHSNWTFPVWWGCCLAWLYDKKLVMSPRGGLDPIRLAHSAWKKKMVGWMDRWCFKHATIIHATSAAEYDWVVRYLGEGCKSKTRVIPNGLSVPDDECDRLRCSTLEGKKTVLSLGRLHPLKGLDLLVEAWHILSVAKETEGWRLMLVGPDEQGVKSKLLEQCEKLNLKDCEFCDGIYDGGKWEVLRKADVFVLPSRSENFGNVAGEALACAVPVVMTDVGPWRTEMDGCLNLCASNRPVHFVETSASGIADGLSKVMALNDGTRAEMGHAGRAWVRQEFRWERVAERMIEAYAD